MKRLWISSLLLSSLILGAAVDAAEARPARVPYTQTINKTGRYGGNVQGQATVVPTANGVKAGGSGTIYGPRGGSGSANGTFSGNQTSGSMQGSANWSAPNSSGSASGSATYNQGTVNGSGTVSATSQKTGQTYSGSGSATYNKTTGGAATVTTQNGTKTYTLPPAPSQ